MVVDASIVVKWFLEEPYSGEALELRDDYIRGRLSIAVPSLLFYEVLNAVKHSGVYSEEEVEEVGRAIDKYGFDLYELRGKYKLEAVKVAVEEDVTVYDASYVALAKHLKTVFYTADEELVRKFPGIALHIKDYGRHVRARG